MTYRFPVVIGDRVALAPHTDLYMMGYRYGNVADVERVAALYDARRYLVALSPTRSVWFRADDLLGAVNPVPGGAASPSRVSGNTDPSEPDCAEFREFGSCIHSDHMTQAGL